MVDKFCEYLTNKIRKEMPDINDEKAEIILYGVQLIIGEIPKIAILFLIAFILKIGWLAVFAFIAILPYRSSSGGFHMKTHLGCIICTSTLYCGTVLLSKITNFDPFYLKYIVIGAIWIFGMLMVSKYAPADTENVPIISRKERKKKKILSYVTLTITLIVACIIPDRILSNILIYGMLFQSIFITRIAYKITKNQYGYEVYKANGEIL